MAAIHETAYPRIKPNLNHKELRELFTPTIDELTLLNWKTKQALPVLRLGFMLTLKYYQCLGRPIKIQNIMPAIKKYVAIQIGVDPELSLSNYSKLTRFRHIKIIREYLNINIDCKERRQIMKTAALDAATRKENLADIVNIVLEELIKSNFELPVFPKLVRLARAARVIVNNNNYLFIYDKLSDGQRELIDFMLNTKENNSSEHLSWFSLKQEPKKPTIKKVNAFINHTNKLKTIWKAINIDLSV